MRVSTGTLRLQKERHQYSQELTAFDTCSSICSIEPPGDRKRLICRMDFIHISWNIQLFWKSMNSRSRTTSPKPDIDPEIPIETNDTEHEMQPGKKKILKIYFTFIRPILIIILLYSAAATARAIITNRQHTHPICPPRTIPPPKKKIHKPKTNRR